MGKIQALPSAYDKDSCCPQPPSELKMRPLRNTPLKGTTHVETCNVEVKFELAEIGAEKGKNSLFSIRFP